MNWRPSRYFASGLFAVIDEHSLRININRGDVFRLWNAFCIFLHK